MPFWTLVRRLVALIPISAIVLAWRHCVVSAAPVGFKVPKPTSVPSIALIGPANGSKDLTSDPVANSGSASGSGHMRGSLISESKVNSGPPDRTDARPWNCEPMTIHDVETAAPRSIPAEHNRRCPQTRACGATEFLVMGAAVMS